MKRWAIQVTLASLTIALLLVAQTGKELRSYAAKPAGKQQLVSLSLSGSERQQSAWQAGAPVISPQNAANLQLIDQDQYSPWDLVHAIAWAPDSRQFAVTAGEKLLLYQPPNLTSPSEHRLGVWTPGIAYHPTQPWLVLGGRDGSLTLFDLNRNAPRWKITAHPKGITRLAVDPNGEWLASGGYEAYSRRWDFQSGENLAEMIGGTYAIPDLAITPDGLQVAIANGNVIRLREAASGRIALSVYAGESITSLAFSADGTRMATGGANGILELWSLPANASGSAILDESIQLPNPAAELARGLDRLVWEVTFNPAGTLLAVAQGDGQIQLWNIADREIAAILAGHPGGVTCIAFSPDGRTLVSGGIDATLRLWQVSP